MSSGETRPSLGQLLSITTIIVLIDQLTKILIKGSQFLGITGVPLGSSRPLLDDIFRITYEEPLAEAEKRFAKWLDDSLIRGFAEWRRTLL